MSAYKDLYSNYERRAIIQETRSIYSFPSSTASGSYPLPDTDEVGLENLVPGTTIDLTIDSIPLYLGKRIHVSKPQSSGVNVNIVSNTGQTFFSSTSGTISTYSLLTSFPDSVELFFVNNFNISVLGTSGSGSPTPVTPQQTRTIYVSPLGLPTNSGLSDSPLDTLQNAINLATSYGDASPTSQYKIIAAGSRYSENLSLVPYINILSNSGDNGTSVTLDGDLDFSGLDTVISSTLTFESFTFTRSPTQNLSGFSNAPYIRFVDCDFQNGQDMDLTLNQNTVFGFIGCGLESDNMFLRGGGWIISNCKSLSGNGYVEIDDTGSSTVEAYLLNYTNIPATVHLKCSNNVGANFHIGDSYFEQAIQVDNDTNAMLIQYDKLPFANNFSSLTSTQLVRVSDCFSESYTPTDPGDWAIVPNNVKYALDTVANAILYKYTPQSPPNWSSSFSGTVPATLYAALNILANNMFERYSNRFRIQTTIAAFGFNDVNSNILQTTNVAQASLSSSGSFTVSGSSLSLSSTSTSTSILAATSMTLSAVSSVLDMSGRNNVLLYPTGTVGQKTTQIGSSTAKQGIRYIVNDNSGTFGVTSGTVDLFSLTLLEPAISRSAYTGVVKICISDGLAPTVFATYYRPFVISGDGVSTYTINLFGAAIYQYATFGWPFGFPTFVMVVSGGSLSLNFNTGGAITPKINTYIEIERLN